jgi:hypothetical protein
MTSFTTRQEHVLRQRSAPGQTFVFFLVTFGTVFLLCGLALDAGMLYLTKAKLSRACDASVVSGVASFGRGRDEVARAMRASAIANCADLAVISSTPTITSSGLLQPNGQYYTNYIYTYTATNGTTTQFVATIQQTPTLYGTMAIADGRVQSRTYFMGFSGINQLMNYNVGASATAKRKPRMVALILDHSGSMISNGGYTNLGPAVTNFLNSFDTNGDRIGIYSYGGVTRREMAYTYDFQTLGKAIIATNLKYGGNTAPDDAVRLAMEDMMQEEDFNSAAVTKIIVFFTDGIFNTSHTLICHPGFTNIVYGPPYATSRTTGVQLILSSHPLHTGYNTGLNTYVPFAIQGGTNHIYGSRWLSTNAAHIFTNAIFPTPPPASSFNLAPTNFHTNIRVELIPGAIGYKLRGTNVLWTNMGFFNTNIFVTNIYLFTNEAYAVINPGYTNVPSESSGSTANRIPFDIDADQNQRPDMLTNQPTYYPNNNYFWGSTNMQSGSNWSNTPVTINYQAPNFVSTNYITSKVTTNGWLFYNSAGPMYTPNYINFTPTHIYADLVRPGRGLRFDSTTNNPWAGTGVYTNNASYRLGRMIMPDGSTNIGVMCFSGNPTQFYNFAASGSWASAWNSAWPNQSASNLCYHARGMGITVYSLGVGAASASEDLLQTMANDPAGPVFYSGQPSGIGLVSPNTTDINALLQQIAGKITATITD